MKKNQKIGQENLFYDLILLDLDMPICNGYDACRQINKFYEELYLENYLSPKKVDEPSKHEFSNRIRDSNENIQINRYWMRDLKIIYKLYLDALAL